MTDFSEGHRNTCHICGETFFEPEGKMCSCWKCNNCREAFSDFDMLGNRELMLCIYCDNEKEQVEKTSE